MTQPKLLIEVADGLATLTLNRPDKLNAIDNELAEALLSALDAAASDDAVRAVRVRGAGRAFCAGRDVSAPPTEADLELVQAVSRSIVGLSKLVMFTVHGWTVGAGLEWMLDADIVVAARSSRFKLPEASLGVFVTGGLSATLPAHAGLSRAKALTLLGEEFNAEQAQAWGLVWQVAPDAELDATAQRLASRLVSLRPDVAHRFKRAFNDVGLSNFERAVGLENEAQRELAKAPDAPRGDRAGKTPTQVATQNALPALPSIELGRYRHYKGGEYEVLGVVRHSESLEPLVLYRPLRGNTGSWVRPFAMFLEPVMHDGRHTPRFTRVSAGAPATEDELAATVHRMESALLASSAGGVRRLMEHYQKVSVRFEQDLGAWPRDLLLAKASALMLVQSAAAGS